MNKTKVSAVISAITLTAVTVISPLSNVYAEISAVYEDFNQNDVNGTVTVNIPEDVTAEIKITFTSPEVTNEPYYIEKNVSAGKYSFDIEGRDTTEDDYRNYTLSVAVNGGENKGTVTYTDTFTVPDGNDNPDSFMKSVYSFSADDNFTGKSWDITSENDTEKNIVLHFGGYQTGDLNNDGLVDSVDASVILAEYALISTNSDGTFSDSQKLAGDVNKDNIIDSVDSSMIQSYYAELSTGGNPSWEIKDNPDKTTATATSTATTTSSSATTATTTATSATDYKPHGVLYCSSLPEKIYYNIFEPIDLKGLKVTFEYYDENNEKKTIYNNVSPLDYPDDFKVDTLQFNAYRTGDYVIEILCTDSFSEKYGAYGNDAVASFGVIVQDPSTSTTTTSTTITSKTFATARPTRTTTTSSKTITTSSSETTVTTTTSTGLSVDYSSYVEAVKLLESSRDKSMTFHNYYIYDINHDGIYELITKMGSEKDTEFSVYSIKNNEMVFIGDMSGSYSQFVEYEGNLYSNCCFDGYQIIYSIKLNDTDLSTEIISQTKTDNYIDYGTAINSYDWSDISGIENLGKNTPATTATSTTTVTDTTATETTATTVPQEKLDSAMKKAVTSQERLRNPRYSYFDINNDNIPELLIKAEHQAGIYTNLFVYKNGEFVSTDKFSEQEYICPEKNLLRLKAYEGATVNLFYSISEDGNPELIDSLSMYDSKYYHNDKIITKEEYDSRIAEYDAMSWTEPEYKQIPLYEDCPNIKNAPEDMIYYSSPVNGTVNVESGGLNMRTGAGTDYNIIMLLPKDAEIKILGEGSNWYYIMYNDTSYGYVSADYVKLTY